MKTKIQFLAILFLAATSLLTSCDDDGDTIKPVINLISPAEGELLQIGDASGIHLDMELSDNEKLASYTIDIHINDDGHVHAGTRADDADDKLPAFSYRNTWDDIAGQRNANVHHHDIKIPEGVKPGDYHMVVYCVDAAGNESYAARNIVLTEEEQEGHHH